MKNKSDAKLKKELDKIFSEYIRRKYSDSGGCATCFTCGKKAYWKELQAGHFITRSALATRFDEDNVRPQCIGCNIFGGGRQVQFAEKLQKELGKKIVETLFKKAKQITKYFPYEERIIFYKNKLKEL